MISSLGTLFARATQFLLPSCCSYCKKIVQNDFPLCTACCNEIKPITSLSLPLTKKHAIKVFAVSAYQNPLKRLIIAKHHANLIASVNIAKCIWQLTSLKSCSYDFFVPIPLHWTRYAWRGYNQADIIAQELAHFSEKPSYSLLYRIKNTEYQTKLSSHERQKNVKDAFAVYANKMSHIKGQHIMLVDDLLTTGSTLKSAARALLPYRPASISAVVGCRVV